MELVSLGKEVLQSIAEHAASYRMGQSALRHLDRALWVVEKCARWAVPPPLDQDERPPSELVRPLPWLFFLPMLIALRITRESISLLNLVMGKPPLRSADVVMYIQSKRRYLRTLKYQGNRMMRARSTAPTRDPWYTSLYSLFELTMCFKRQSQNYGNNNTTRVSNNEEVMVVKRNKNGQQDVSPIASGSETTMERLIEKMMLDLDAESDEDSNYTLTNITTPKSDRSDCTIDSDQDTLRNTEASTSKHNGNISQTSEDMHFSPTNNMSSTPEKEITQENGKNDSEKENLDTSDVAEENNKEINNEDSQNGNCTANETVINESPNHNDDDVKLSPKLETQNLIQSESSTPESPRKENKIANGRTVKSVPGKKKGAHKERHHSSEVFQPRALQSNNSF